MPVRAGPRASKFAAARRLRTWAAARSAWASTAPTLLKKEGEADPDRAVGASQLGVFSFAGDLGLKWKHNALVSYGQR